MRLLFELLQVALGNRNEFSTVPPAVEWEALLIEAQRQAIFGVLMDGLERLPEAQRPPQAVLLKWIGQVQLVESNYALHCQRAKELTQLFVDKGYKTCVLKGVGFSQLYPVPARRQGGDIDLWVNAGRKELLRFLRSRYFVEHVFYHHAEARIFDDVETEIHYRPSWMYNPFCNCRLQRWFEKQKVVQMHVDAKLGFACPTTGFDAIYSLVHLYHHLIEEGIGIRHIIDYYYMLRALPGDDKATVKEEIKSLGLSRLVKAMMWVLQTVCGMTDDFLICEPNEKEGRFLLDEIMRGGNFGKYRNDKLRRNTLARMFALLPHYPGEVLWVVPWKLWHKGWRMYNRVVTRYQGLTNIQKR